MQRLPIEISIIRLLDKLLFIQSRGWAFAGDEAPRSTAPTAIPQAFDPGKARHYKSPRLELESRKSQISMGSSTV